MLAMDFYMYWWWSKYVKGIIGVNVDVSVGWVIGKYVGGGVDKKYGDEVCSVVVNEVGEGVEL